MKIVNEEINGVLIVNIKNKDANLSVSEVFKGLIFEQIENGNKNIIISFKEVNYVDSSFLGALVAILKKLITINGKLVIVSLNNDIKHLFNLTRLDKVFTVEETVDSALKHF